MSWRKFIYLPVTYTPPVSRRIPVRQLGIAKAVRVRSKSNGDIIVRKIQVA